MGRKKWGEWSGKGAGGRQRFGPGLRHVSLSLGEEQNLVEARSPMTTTHVGAARRHAAAALRSAVAGAVSLRV